MITGNLQTKNNKFYVVLNLKDKNGKRKQKWINTGLSVRGNKKKAEQILNDIIAEYERKAEEEPSVMAADYFREWLVEIKDKVKPNTYRSYNGNMVNHIIPYFEEKGIALQDLTAKDLDDFYDFKRKSKSLSGTTIKHFHQNISKALADAVHDGKIPYNPAKATQAPKAKKFRAKFLNDSQLNELVQLFKGSVIELPVILCSTYGFRRSEALGLKWEYVDFEKRELTIAETLQQNTGGNYTDTPKTEESYRTMPMIDDIYDILSKHKEEQESRCRLMGEYYTKSDFVCTWNDGKVISPNYMTKTFHAVIQKSNLPQIRLHDLRHSVASNLLSKGFSAVQVAEWMGHSTPATTLNFYAHADKKSKNEIADSISGSLKLK